MKRFWAIIAVLALALALGRLARAQQTVGNGSPPCSFFPTLSVGNGADNCAPVWSWYGTTPFPLPTALSTPIVNTSLPGSRITSILLPDPSKNKYGLACAPLLVSAVIQAGCETFNMQTGTIGTLTQLNSFGNSANAHEDPGGGWIAGGADDILLVNSYSSSDTNNKCFGGTGNPGTAKTCQEVQIGSTVGGGVAFTDISAAGSHVYLPTTTLSEPQCWSWGLAQTSVPSSGLEPYVVCLGQVQANPGQVINGSATQNGGAMGFVTLHPTYSDTLGTTLTHLYADVFNGTSGLTTQDVLTTGASSYYSGMSEITQNVHSDVALKIGPVTESGSGTGGFTLTLPAVGANGPWSCVMSDTTTNAPATDVPNFVSHLNAGSNLTGTGCGAAGAMHTYYSFQTVANTKDCTTASTCIYVVLNSGNPTSLGTISVGTLTGTISSAASYAAATNTSGGNFNFMEWATMRGQSDGSVVFMIPTMNGSSSSSSWAFSNQTYALNFSLFWSPGPVNGVWTIYDVTKGADAWSTTVSPVTPVAALLGGGAGTTCTGYPNCTAVPTVYKTATTTESAPYYVLNATSGNRPASMVPFNFDYKNADLPTTYGTGYAGVDRIDGAYNVKDGDFDLVYPCADTSGNLQLCFARISGTTGLTLNQDFIESGFTSANYVITDVSLVEKNDGTMVVYASNDGGTNTPGGSGSGGQTLRYASSDNTGASWNRTNVYAGTGLTQIGGTVWSSVLDPSGQHVVKETIEQSITGGSACASGCALKLVTFGP